MFYILKKDGHDVSWGYPKAVLYFDALVSGWWFFGWWRKGVEIIELPGNSG